MSKSERSSEFPIKNIYLDRWSPRAFDSSPVDMQDMMTILEAGRWAPSAFNYQPWRFLFSIRGDAHWDQFLSLLIPFNASWAQTAGALVFIVSDELMRSTKGDTPSHSSSFDAGAAWGFMALQAATMGLATHGMTGIDFDKASAALGLPEGFRLEAAFAIGRQGDPAILPEGLQDREFPSHRKPLAELSINGPFPEAAAQNPG